MKRSMGSGARHAGHSSVVAEEKHSANVRLVTCRRFRKLETDSSLTPSHRPAELVAEDAKRL